MINHALRCIYVHIPKTAGNSVNRVFGIDWQDHKDLRRYAGELPPETFEGYYKFAIVRNPWDRILSDYNYQKKKSRPDSIRLYLTAADGERRRFSEWVETALADPHCHPPATWGGDVSAGMHRLSPQMDWITLDGRVAVDRVIRLERLSTEFPDVCRSLGIAPRRLPRRNRRLHWHYSWYYDEPTMRRVAEYYARDIAAFGYRFDSLALRLAEPLRRVIASPFFFHLQTLLFRR